VTEPTADEVFAAAVEHRRAQIANWGKWVARHDILTDTGVLAFREGTPVPVEHVERFGWDQGDDPHVILRKEAEKQEGFVLDGIPSVATEEAIMNALTSPSESASADTGEQPKGSSSTKSASKSNKSTTS